MPTPNVFHKLLIQPQARFFMALMKHPHGLSPVWIENHDGNLYRLSTESKELFDLWCSTLTSMRLWFEIRSS